MRISKCVVKKEYFIYFVQSLDDRRLRFFDFDDDEEWYRLRRLSDRSSRLLLDRERERERFDFDFDFFRCLCLCLDDRDERDLQLQRKINFIFYI